MVERRLRGPIAGATRSSHECAPEVELAAESGDAQIDAARQPVIVLIAAHSTITFERVPLYGWRLGACQ
jgi:hypothetical protein